ncbi:MAG: flippase-like domain-containing protein [Chloroflexi bacterium]|nr:flippase-like domain-containing protein [Chloroflexota bacterium]
MAKLLGKPSTSTLDLPVTAAVAGDDMAESDLSLRRRFFNIQTFVSFGIAFAILYFFLTRVDVDLAATVARIRQANVGLLLVAFLTYYLTFVLRGLRWRLLLGNVGFSASNGVQIPSVPGLARMIYLSWFANCVVPAKLGDAYRGYLLKRRAGVSFSTTMGTVLAERIIDMTVLFGLLILSALSTFGGQDSTTATAVLRGGLAVVILIAIGLVIMRRLGHRIEALLPWRLQAIYRRFQAGTLGSFRQLPWVVALTVLVWLTEAGRMYFVTQSLGIGLGVALILFVALANSFLTAVPFTPGGLGLVEAGVIGLLMIALPKQDAASIALLDRTISYWSLVAFGLLVYLLTEVYHVTNGRRSKAAHRN